MMKKNLDNGQKHALKDTIKPNLKNTEHHMKDKQTNCLDEFVFIMNSKVE